MTFTGVQLLEVRENNTWWLVYRVDHDSQLRLTHVMAAQIARLVSIDG